MKLYIMRHGQAESWASSDAERALTEFGQQQVQSAAMQLQGVPLTGILASPYLRARQTADIVRQTVAGPEIIISDNITPDASPAEAIESLPDSGNWLLVAHMPLVSRLTGLLTEGRVNYGLSFSTAMVAELEMEFPAADFAILKRVFTP